MWRIDLAQTRRPIRARTERRARNHIGRSQQTAAS
jgi:hypothetical protein